MYVTLMEPEDTNAGLAGEFGGTNVLDQSGMQNQMQ